MSWDKQQAKTFAKAAQQKCGKQGWARMSEVQREEAVAAEIMRVLLSQHLPAYEPIQKMIRDTMHAAGLWENG